MPSPGRPLPSGRDRDLTCGRPLPAACQPVPDLSDGSAGSSDPLRPLAISLHELAELFRLQLLLHRTPLHFSCGAPGRRADGRLLPGGRGHRRQPGGAAQGAGRGDAQITRRTANLYDFSRRIAGAAALNDVLWAAVHHVASTLQCHSLVLLPHEGDRLEIASGYPPEDQMSPTAWGAAHWAWQHNQAAGWSSGTLPASEWLFLPLKTARGALGLLGVCVREPETAADAGAARPARGAGRPGRGRDRADQPRDRYRAGAPADRDGAPALRAAFVGLARSAHAPGLDHRLGHRAGEL